MITIEKIIDLISVISAISFFLIIGTSIITFTVIKALDYKQIKILIAGNESYKKGYDDGYNDGDNGFDC